MTKMPKYFIVEASVLPEIYLKVAETKQLLERGIEKTVNAATQRTGISRSAFYKYKDAVQPFQDMLHGRILTFQLMLRDEPGSLSPVLNIFAEHGVNILTISQGLPISGSAVVSIGAETSALAISVEEFLHTVDKLDGVLRCEVLAG